MKKSLRVINMGILAATSIFLLSACASGGKEISNNPISNAEEKVEVLKLGQDKDGNNTNYYFYDAEQNGYKSIRSNILTPDYYIFAGNKTNEEANQLLTELNMIDNIREWGSKVYFINPINGESYTDEDKESFIDLVGGAVRNVKVIGIEEGATFVNNKIAESCYFIAGIMTYGGEIDENVKKNDVVPVYLSNTNTKVEEFYKNINEATEKDKNDKYTIYRNKENSLQAVAVGNDKESLKEAFNNAWESIFSKNFRQHNTVAEFYNLGVRDVTDNYELIETALFDEIGISYNQMIDEKVTGMDGKYTWFEYVPNKIQESKDSSVPLIVTLHGNQNDPRLQGDSTGWPELAVKENFIVVSPEWQEKEVNFFKCDGLGDDGIMNLIEDLKVKYPQIDSSRIYLTGLSAGGAKSFHLGAKYSNVFAGIASVSGVNVYANEIKEIANNYSGIEIPLLYLCGDHDFFQMIPVDGSSKYGTAYLYGDQVWDEDENTHIFSTIQSYQKMNGLKVDEMDMSKNEYYGIELENQRWTKLGNKDMYTGTLSNENGVVIELAAIKDLAHWNYKPEAEYIWNFFKGYERNTETGELIFIK